MTGEYSEEEVERMAHTLAVKANHLAETARVRSPGQNRLPCGALSTGRSGEQRFMSMTLHQFHPRPKWHRRASRSEIKEVSDIDRLIGELRKRRQAILNRINMRTEVWAAHHQRKRA